MSESGTWKKELGKKDQIIALSTKVAELQSKLDKQVIAFATQENKEVTSSAGGGGGGSCRKKRDGHYTVPAWRLIKKEDKVVNTGKEYYWCSGDHYSGGVKHNGMYADHKTCNHNEWRSKMEKRSNSRNRSKKPDETPAKPANDLIKSLLSMTSFTVPFILRLAFLLKQSIGSGNMLRETSRSESRVE